MGDWLQDRCNSIQKAQQEHVQKAFEPDIEKARSGIYKPIKQNIEKGGEGSKGGNVIGHDKMGKPIYASKQVSGEKRISSGNAQHALENSERKEHSKYMKDTHGVDTKYHGEDELSYHGTKKQVKSAINNHYDGDKESAKELHPHLYKK